LSYYEFQRKNTGGKIWEYFVNNVLVDVNPAFCVIFQGATKIKALFLHSFLTDKKACLRK